MEVSAVDKITEQWPGGQKNVQKAEKPLELTHLVMRTKAQGVEELVTNNIDDLHHVLD